MLTLALIAIGALLIKFSKKMVLKTWNDATMLRELTNFVLFVLGISIIVAGLLV